MQVSRFVITLWETLVINRRRCSSSFYKPNGWPFLPVSYHHLWHGLYHWDLKRTNKQTNLVDSGTRLKVSFTSVNFLELK